jgi:hypothetical protein
LESPAARGEREDEWVCGWEKRVRGEKPLRRFMAPILDACRLLPSFPHACTPFLTLLSPMSTRRERPNQACLGANFWTALRTVW